MAKKKTKSASRREEYRKEFFKDLKLWTGDEDGWFKAPRTLPLLLALISSKQIKGKGTSDLASTYLELWSRHMGEGIIEMKHELDHAFAAGYEGSRALRTWQERMKALEQLGLIRTTPVGNERYKFVALIHPTEVLKELYADKKIPQAWLGAYRSRIIETKEVSFLKPDKEDLDTQFGSIPAFL